MDSFIGGEANQTGRKSGSAGAAPAIPGDSSVDAASSTMGMLSGMEENYGGSDAHILLAGDEDECGQTLC